jgi:hypothetical protein
VGQGTGRAGNSLHFNFNIAANSWGTCATFFERPQSWYRSGGLTFVFRTAQTGQVFDVDLYTGPSAARATYVFTVQAPPEGAEDWVPMRLNWQDFQRASWEENAGAVFTDSTQVTGMAIGLTAPQDASNVGELWIDDLQVFGVSSAPVDEPKAIPTAVPTKLLDTGDPVPGRSLPCTGGLVLPIFLLGFVGLNGRKR